VTEDPASQTPPAEGEASKKGVRPLPLTIFCALGFMSFPLFLSQYGSEFTRTMQHQINGREHFHWFFVIYAGMIAGYVGLWLMRRWGYHLFILATLAMGVHLAMGTRNMLEFRQQVQTEAKAVETGEEAVKGRFDTSFLAEPAFQNPGGKGVSLRDAVLASTPGQVKTTAVLRLLPPLFVILVAFVVRDRFR